MARQTLAEWAQKEGMALELLCQWLKAIAVYASYPSRRNKQRVYAHAASYDAITDVHKGTLKQLSKNLLVQVRKPNRELLQSLLFILNEFDQSIFKANAMYEALIEKAEKR